MSLQDDEYKREIVLKRLKNMESAFSRMVEQNRKKKGLV